MPETVADGIPYLMTGDFCGTNELNFNSVKMISENDYRQLSQKIKPEQGDIIFARYASVGAARYVDFTRKFLISYSCAIIKQSKKIDSKYLYHFITSASAQKQIKIEINTGSQANIGIDSMKNNIIVDMPLPEEQRKIGIFLTQIDHLITLHQRKPYSHIQRRCNMLNEAQRTDKFCEYYAKWITVYKKGAIRQVTMDKYLMTQKWLEKLIPDLKICDLNRIA